MAHHHRWWSVKTVHQQSQFLVDGQVKRAVDPLHSLVAQPCFRRAQQGAEEPVIIFCFQHPEKPGGILITVYVQLVDLSADPAYRFTVPIGYP